MKRRSGTYDDNVRQHRKRPHGLSLVLVVLFAALLVLCAYAGHFSPRSFFPAPFLTLGYMPMLILSLALALICLVFRRWMAAIILALAMMVTLPTFSLFVPLNGEPDVPAVPADGTSRLKVMTYNVLSFNYNESRKNDQPSSTMRLILEADPDVVMLQEGGAAGIDWEEIPSLQPLMSKVRQQYPHTFTSPEGLNILSKYPFTTTALGKPRHARSALGYNRENTSYLARAYDLQLPSGKQLRLIDFRLQSYHLQFGKNQNVRVSPDVKPAPLERMRRAFALRGNDAAAIRREIDASPGNLIVCGDMNDVPSSHVYRVIRGEDMIDAWSQVGNGYAYTFNRYNLPFRIDHILYRGELAAMTAARLKGGSSDHYPIMVTFDITPN